VVYQDGPSGYEYANSAALARRDSLGLQSSASPRGTGKCLGKPNGVVPALGRGLFVRTTLTIFNTWMYWGAALTGEWRPDRNSFVDRNGCCCKELGIIQIAAVKVRWGGTESPPEISPYDYFIDGGVPYRKGSSVNPCLKSYPAQTISFNDGPRARKHSFLFPIYAPLMYHEILLSALLTHNLIDLFIREKPCF